MDLIWYLKCDYSILIESKTDSICTWSDPFTKFKYKNKKIIHKNKIKKNKNPQKQYNKLLIIKYQKNIKYKYNY